MISEKLQDSVIQYLRKYNLLPIFKTIQHNSGSINQGLIIFLQAIWVLQQIAATKTDIIVKNDGVSFDINNITEANTSFNELKTDGDFNKVIKFDENSNIYNFTIDLAKIVAKCNACIDLYSDTNKKLLEELVNTEVTAFCKSHNIIDVNINTFCTNTLIVVNNLSNDISNTNLTFSNILQFFALKERLIYTKNNTEFTKYNNFVSGGNLQKLGNSLSINSNLKPGIPGISIHDIALLRSMLVDDDKFIDQTTLDGNTKNNLKLLIRYGKVKEMSSNLSGDISKAVITALYSNVNNSEWIFKKHLSITHKNLGSDIAGVIINETVINTVSKNIEPVTFENFQMVLPKKLDKLKTKYTELYNKAYHDKALPLINMINTNLVFKYSSDEIFIKDIYTEIVTKNNIINVSFALSCLLLQLNIFYIRRGKFNILTLENIEIPKPIVEVQEKVNSIDLDNFIDSVYQLYIIKNKTDAKINLIRDYIKNNNKYICCGYMLLKLNLIEDDYKKLKHIDITNNIINIVFTLSKITTDISKLTLSSTTITFSEYIMDNSGFVSKRWREYSKHLPNKITLESYAHYIKLMVLQDPNLYTMEEFKNLNILIKYNIRDNFKKARISSNRNYSFGTNINLFDLLNHGTLIKSFGTHDNNLILLEHKSFMYYNGLIKETKKDGYTIYYNGGRPIITDNKTDKEYDYFNIIGDYSDDKNYCKLFGNIPPKNCKKLASYFFTDISDQNQCIEEFKQIETFPSVFEFKDIDAKELPYYAFKILWALGFRGKIENGKRVWNMEDKEIKTHLKIKSDESAKTGMVEYIQFLITAVKDLELEDESTIKRAIVQTQKLPVVKFSIFPSFLFPFPFGAPQYGGGVTEDIIKIIEPFTKKLTELDKKNPFINNGKMDQLLLKVSSIKKVAVELQNLEKLISIYKVLIHKKDKSPIVDDEVTNMLDEDIKKEEDRKKRAEERLASRLEQFKKLGISLDRYYYRWVN